MIALRTRGSNPNSRNDRPLSKNSAPLPAAVALPVVPAATIGTASVFRVVLVASAIAYKSTDSVTAERSVSFDAQSKRVFYALAVRVFVLT
jgi:hypothetical protein